MSKQTRREARREVRLSYRPLRNQYRRARRQARQDTRQYESSIAELGGQLQSGLGSAASFYDQNTAGLADQTAASINSLAPYFNQGIGAGSPTERSAGLGLTGTIGAGTLEQLGTARSRNAGYSSSAMREGTEQQYTLGRNAQIDLKNFQNELRQQLLDAKSGIPQEIRALDLQKQREAFDRRMALAQLALQQQGMDLQAGAQNASNRLYDAVLGYIDDYFKTHPDADIGDLGGLFG